MNAYRGLVALCFAGALFVTPAARADLLDPVRERLAAAEAKIEAGGVEAEEAVRLLLETGRPDLARVHLRALVERYPGTRFARLARERLAQ